MIIGPRHFERARREAEGALEWVRSNGDRYGVVQRPIIGGFRAYRTVEVHISRYSLPAGTVPAYVHGVSSQEINRLAEQIAEIEEETGGLFE